MLISYDAIYWWDAVEITFLDGSAFWFLYFGNSENEKEQEDLIKHFVIYRLCVEVVLFL